MKPEYEIIILAGFLFSLLCIFLILTGIIYSPTDTPTYVGTVQKVEVTDTKVTLTLDSQIIQFRLSRDQILQPPLEIGSRYQIDLNKYDFFIGEPYYTLRSITKLPREQK